MSESSLFRDGWRLERSINSSQKSFDTKICLMADIEGRSLAASIFSIQFFWKPRSKIRSLHRTKERGTRHNLGHKLGLPYRTMCLFELDTISTVVPFTSHGSGPISRGRPQCRKKFLKMHGIDVAIFGVDHVLLEFSSKEFSPFCIIAIIVSGSWLSVAVKGVDSRVVREESC